MKKIRMARDGYVLISIIFYIVGIVCMTIPSISPLVLQYDLACGIFLIVLGVIVLGCNLRIRSYLSPGLGLLILLDAVLKVQTAKDAKVFGLEIWKWILTLSIIVATFGILIIIKPFQESQISHVIIGCGFFAEGLMNHLTVKDTVKISKQIQGQEKNEEDTDWEE